MSVNKIQSTNESESNVFICSGGWGLIYLAAANSEFLCAFKVWD